MQKLLTDSFWTLFSRGMATASGLVVSVLIARSLGPENLGIYVFIVLIVSTVGHLANPGIYAGANYYLSSHRLPRGKVFTLTVCLTLPGALIGAVISVFSLLVGPLNGSASAANRGLLFGVAIAALFTVIGISFHGITIGIGRIKIASRGLAMTSVLHGSVVAGLWLSDTLTLATCTLAYCSFQIIKAIVYMILTLPVWSDSLRIDRREIKPFLRYSLAVYSGRVLTFLSRRIDSYLVLIIAGQAALGYYSVAANLAGQIGLIPMAVGLSMMPNIGSLTAEASARTVLKTSQIIFVVMLTLGLFIGVAGVAFIPILYGEVFMASIIPLLLMIPGIVAIGVYLIVEPYFQARGLPQIPVKISFVGAMSNGVLCIILIPPYGIVGASMAYTISFLIQTLTTCIAFSKQSSLPLYSLLNIRNGVSNGLDITRNMIHSARVNTVVDA